MYSYNISPSSPIYIYTGAHRKKWSKSQLISYRILHHIRLNHHPVGFHTDSTTIPSIDQIIMISKSLKIRNPPNSKIQNISKSRNLQTTATDEITIVRHAAADTIHSVHNDQVAEAAAADNGPELGPDTMSAASYRLHPQSLDHTESDG